MSESPEAEREAPVAAPAEVLDRPAPPAVLTAADAVALPAGVQPSRNYVAAIELGHVLAASGYYTDARDPAKAAVKVMIGMDLGVSPTAAIQAIHTMEDNGRTVFLIESKLLAAVVKGRPDVEYKIIHRDEKKVEVEFLRRNGEGEWEAEGPNVTWTIEHAKKAVKGFDKKPTWKGIPAVMLTWRVLAEGFRLYFPDVLAGQPIYAMEELDVDADELKLRERLEEPKAQPLTDEKAERLRSEIRKVKDELDEIDPDLVNPVRFANAIAKAEHSHEQLENVKAGYEFLRDQERRFVEVVEQLRETMEPDELDALVERARRRGQPQERVALVEAALPKSEEGEGDADPADPPAE